VTAWPIYTGIGDPHDGIDLLPAPPNWRSFDGRPILPSPAKHNGAPDPTTARRLGLDSHQREPDPQELQMINAALFLRRPLLITGRPGTGKSTIAYKVAKELKLGSVLRWPITSRSTLREGLYRYDPIGRLREEKQRQEQRPDGDASAAPSLSDSIGRHLRLGPLGTALLPYAKPRVLLIDEIDKSDIDLPNDLLNVFEEGEYEIDELTQLPEEASTVPVMTAESGSRVEVNRGQVRCNAFPFVVLTSNGEREFPPAFLRRCLRLDLQPPDASQLTAIVSAHLGPIAAAEADRHVRAFLAKRERAEVTTDQLLNAVYLATSGSRYEGKSPEEVIKLDELVDAVLRPLTGPE
jgi:MoxR-like ATPase